MKIRLSALLLVLIMTISCVLALSACTQPTQEELCAKGEHIDEDGNDICDACKEVLREEPENPGEDEKYTFTLTVTDYLGAPISGLKVKFLYNNSSAETDVVTTGADGKAVVEIATEREVIAEFVDLEDWGTPKKRALTFSAMEYEKTVELTPVVKVILKDASGAAVVGAKVALCNNGGCSADYTSDEMGVCRIPIKKDGKYKLRVTYVPDGYVMPAVIEGDDTPETYDDYHAYYDENLTEFEFVIEKA